MKVFLLALFVAAAVALPTPLEEEIGEPVELIVNGVPDGEPLDLGDVLGVKVQQHIDGELAVATDLLHPLTSQGIAEAAAASELEPIPDARQMLPEPMFKLSAVLPEAVSLPEPAVPEVVPEIVFEPEIVSPEVVPGPVGLPEPQIAGEVYNDGLVQVKVNGVLSTVQSWFTMVMNYFNGDVQTTHQIV